MANTIQIDIVSAEEEIWSGEGTMVFAPAEMGEIGIAPQHAPLLTRLNPGEIRVQQESGEEQFFYVSGGMLEVKGHIVTVLSDTALRAPDLDEAAHHRPISDYRRRRYVPGGGGDTASTNPRLRLHRRSTWSRRRQRHQPLPRPGH